MSFKTIDLSRCKHNGGSDWAIPEDTVGVHDLYDFNSGDNREDVKNGVFTFIGSGSVYVKESIPSSALHPSVDPSEASRGLAYDYPSSPIDSPDGDVTREQRCFLTGPYSTGYREIWGYYKMLQPINFEHRKIMNMKFNAGAVDAWEIGDEIVAQDSGATGVIGDLGPNEIFVIQPSHVLQFAYINQNVTNVTKGDTKFCLQDTEPRGTNNKFFTPWVGDYSNGRFGFEVVAGHSDLGQEYGSSYAKGKRSPIADTGNPFGTGDPSMDIADNGKIVEYWFHCKRESAQGAGDARLRMLRKSDSTNNQWLKVFDSGPVGSVFVSDHDNKFTAFYSLGSSNSRYTEATSFYIMQMGIYSVMPAELEGVI